MELFNPNNEDLRLCDRLALRWDNDDDMTKDVSAYIEDYNKSSHDDEIVAWRMGFSGDDVVMNKITMIFYIKNKNNGH